MRTPQTVKLNNAVRRYSYNLINISQDNATAFSKRLTICGSPPLNNLPLIQCRDRFYYGLFPGLFSGVAGRSGSMTEEYRILRLAILKARTVTADDYDAAQAENPFWLPPLPPSPVGRDKVIGFLDEPKEEVDPQAALAASPASLDMLAGAPGSALGCRLKRGLGFRWATEVKYLDATPYFSLEALRGLLRPCQALLEVRGVAFHVALIALAEMHRKEPWRVRPKRGQKPAVPLANRPVVDGRRARGKSWAPDEDKALRDNFGAEMRARLQADRKARRAEREMAIRLYEKRRLEGTLAPDATPPEPWDERAERAKHEHQIWDQLLGCKEHNVPGRLHERTRNSIYARVNQLNREARRKYFVDGVMPIECVASYQNEMLAIRKTLPRKRPKLPGVQLKNDKVPRSFSFRAWTPEEDGIIYDFFRWHALRANDPDERKNQLMRSLGWAREYELVVERARVMKEKGFLNCELPTFRRRRGRPGKAVLATQRAPLAIPDAVLRRTVPL